MKYLSIDIETTGLSPTENDILEIGAYLEDTTTLLPREQLPYFHIYLDMPTFRGNAFALAMNHEILKKIAELQKAKDKVLLCPPNEVSARLQAFLDGQFIVDKIIPAGKNFGSFDLQFLRQLPNFDKVKLHHRQIDPTMLFTDFKKDIVPPDLSACKKLAKLPEAVTHQALDDSWDVISLMRTKY